MTQHFKSPVIFLGWGRKIGYGMDCRVRFSYEPRPGRERSSVLIHAQALGKRGKSVRAPP